MSALRILILTAALAAVQAVACAQTNHLLISEVAINSVGTGNNESDTTSGEYLEIFNPTGLPVSLDNYYLSDYQNYYDIVTTPTGFNGGNSDYMLRFPAGTTLGSGKTLVVTQSANQFATDYFSGNLSGFTGQAGAPQLFEVADTQPGVPNMISLNTTPGGAVTFSKTNGGEFVALFFWNGASDLVQDVDVVSWGVATGPTGTAAFLPKTTALAKDGPDADAVASNYKNDAGGVNLVVTDGAATPASPAVITRTSSTETGETTTAGNGLTGHDESTETAASTWTGSASTSATNTPGVSTLTAYTASVQDWTSFE